MRGSETRREMPRVKKAMTQISAAYQGQDEQPLDHHDRKDDPQDD